MCGSDCGCHACQFERAYEKAQDELFSALYDRGNTNEPPICPICEEDIEEDGLCFCDVREALGLPDFC